MRKKSPWKAILITVLVLAVLGSGGFFGFRLRLLPLAPNFPPTGVPGAGETPKSPSPKETPPPTGGVPLGGWEVAPLGGWEERRLGANLGGSWEEVGSRLGGSWEQVGRMS